MKGSRIVAASAALLFALSASVALAGKPVKPPPPPPPPPAGNVFCTWADDRDSSHLAISGEAVALRGVAKSDSTTLTYTWDFGDGSPVETGAVGLNPYVIETSHVYTGTLGQVFTATLTVKEGAATIGGDTYSVVIAADDVTTRKKIAIEKGLWYLHTMIKRDTTVHGGQIRGQIGRGAGTSWEWDTTLNTMVTGTAMAESGFKATGSADNPYTEDLQRLVNFVTERLAITPIGVKGGGNSGLPELNPENRTAGGVIDGYGVYFKETSDREFEYGTALRFLANMGLTTQKPLAFDNDLNYTGNPSVSIGNWTYAEIVQQMIDFFAWVQLYDKGINYDANPGTDEFGNVLNNGEEFAGVPDIVRSATVVPANKRGGWPYWGDGWSCDTKADPDCANSLKGAYGDTAMAYWIVTGLKPAQQMGCAWPDFVKTELNTFLQNNQDLVKSSPYYGEFHFGEAYGQHLVERAGQGLVLLNWVGVAKSNARVTSAKNYIGTFWNKDNHDLDQSWRTNDRGFLGCTSRDGTTAEDCFQHFSLGAYPYGYNIFNMGVLCDQYQCAQTATGCYWCATYDEMGNCTSCYPGYEYEYCAVEDKTVCLAPNGFYTGYTSEWVEVQWDALNVFAFLCVTEGMKANGFIGFPTTDPYNTRYVELLVNNQFPNGSWHDKGWINEGPFGTSWAVMTLSKL